MAKKGIFINNLKTHSDLSAQEFRKKFKNAQLSLNTSANVVIKDSTFDQNGYNCLEIGLNDKMTPPANVTITNCHFKSELTNNAILIFGTQDNAVITIKDCTFNKISNLLRLSNRTNARNVTVNIENCSVEQWETNPTWAGFLLFEDHVSKNMEEFNQQKRFDPTKLTINVVNLTHKGEHILPSDLASVTNTKKLDQLIMMVVDKADNAFPPYSKDIFPTINFK